MLSSRWRVKSRLPYGRYSKIAGTGTAPATSGIHIRAASRQPSDRGIQTFSTFFNSDDDTSSLRKTREHAVRISSAMHQPFAAPCNVGWNVMSCRMGWRACPALYPEDAPELLALARSELDLTTIGVCCSLFTRSSQPKPDDHAHATLVRRWHPNHHRAMTADEG